MVKKALLLQFRDDVSAAHEYLCFQKALKMDETKLHVINAITDEFTDFPQKLSDYSFMLIGGSGQYNMSEPHPFLQLALSKTKALFDYIFENDFPTFGVCFGHQLLSHKVGLVVERNPTMAESGNYDITLLSVATNEPIYAGIPQTFSAIEGHNDSVILSGEVANYTVLAKSAKCPVQAFKFKKNIFGVQFHPELNPAEVAYRYSLYPSYVKISGKSIEELKAELNETPFALKILENFKNKYF